MDRKTFLRNLLEGKESAQLELLPVYEVRSIIRAVCAFLNSDGGWVVVGYPNDKQAGYLGDDADNLADQIEIEIANQIFPQPLVYAKALRYKEQDLILINVVRGSRQPYSFEGKHFVRTRGQVRPAQSEDLSLLIRSSSEYTSLWEKSATIDAEMEELNLDEIYNTIFEAQKIGKGKKLPEQPEAFLSYFQLKDYQTIKNGAVLLFGRDPIKYLPQARIRITVMPEEKTAERYADSHLIEENLFDAFTELKRYFTTTLPMASDFKQGNWDRLSRERFPSEAIDEAIVNAMVHRDYGDVAGEITINIYSNRMEIINSGEIPDDIIEGKNRISPHHSILRNPTISHMFYLRGKMEKLGRGLDLILSSCERDGLKKPEWLTKGGYTTLTLYSVAEQIVVNERMSIFLQTLHEGVAFGSKDYNGFFKDISEKTARLDIAKLVSGQWVEKVGDGPSTRYYRTGKKLPEITG
ncbi:ATP-binding protein [Pedobacter paludis]|uniref:Schlafen AlbA-2 domain-containing protein n=1 Tax=Pedobacter paludis TaxID=2203212 RepID=A0A317F444_9SPHI|nr:ATP-binding protein [Pedobacter paludis]PWS32258.1 hypothetical protein DF947_10850 [Pedobacter paludis]